MTMVQHVESRIPLGSVDTNDQLHEFQIVHAIITQCRKSAADDNSRNNNQGCENQGENNKKLVRTRGSSPKEGRSSFVNKICRTFNALAQATNPSLCAKQNMSSHPVTIASTVKNIISQFSGQNYHGALCLASPCEPPPVRDPPRNTVRRTANIQKATQSKATIVQNNSPPPNRLTPQPAAVPSTSKPKEVNKAGKSNKKTESSPPKVPPQKSEPPVAKAESPAVAPKLRSVRARNANRLMRHSSAPIPHPDETKAMTKSSTSVRRSKSDAICYRSYHRRQQRKIDSNVQTKVLHFENCCKGKGQAAMCVECRKHNVSEEAPVASETPSASKINLVKEKQENYAGALSYHKPSTITQSQKSGDPDLPGATSTNHPSMKVDPPRTTPPLTKPKAIPCPGGTYFPATVVTQPTVMEVGTPSRTTNPRGVVTNISDEPIPLDGGDTTPAAAAAFCGLAESLCSQNKRKHSSSAEDETQCKRESRENVTGNTKSQACSEKCNIDQDVSGTSVVDDNAMDDADSVPQENLSSSVRVITPTGDDSPYSEQCNKNSDNAADTDVMATSAQISDNNTDTLSSPQQGEVANATTDPEPDIHLSLSDDSSDAVESLSSCGEACDSQRQASNDDQDVFMLRTESDSFPSPRQEYLSGTPRASTLRRVPSSRYRRMRRKLKRLISRPRSYPEAQIPSYTVESQDEVMERYLDSIRIPAPVFMLGNSTENTFTARRQQLAMRLDSSRDWMSSLPDHIMTQIFSYLDTRSLAMLKCVCKDFEFIVDMYDIRGTDSQWVKDERYMEDPCKFCRKRFTTGDVSMCRYHAKSYHCDLPYGRSYWTCCFKIERNAPGCRTGIHNNHWRTGAASGD